MKTDITIRKAVNSDLPAIYDLVKELAKYERAESEVTATIQDYETDFQAQVFQVLLAISGKQIVGAVIYYLTYSTWKGRMMYLEDFIISERFRRNGIGQLLFDAFLEEASHQNARLTKWQVLDWNEPAIRFYKKNEASIETNWLTCKKFLTH